MNQFSMIAFIVLVVMIASVFKARYKFIGQGRDPAAGALPNAEAARLRAEMTQLKDRLAVLERITVEKENSLAREIDELRDRPRV
jgi:hypothetical protein